MDVREYNRADNEVIAVVNENHRKHRDDEQVAAENQRKEMITIQRRENSSEEWKSRAWGLASVAARVTFGMLFLGAVAREWIVPALGIVASLLCFTWAYVTARRNALSRRNA